MNTKGYPRPTFWAQKEFNFPQSLDDRESITHHLSTFPSQCSISLENLDHSVFKRRIDGKWSIQEHLGHLLDLDDLVTKRIKEILEGTEIMTAADMDNQHTWDQNYNEQNVYEICEAFMQRRKELMQVFSSVSERDWLKSAYHERLDRKMSILDLAYFQTQHDQYHQEMILHLAHL